MSEDFGRNAVLVALASGLLAGGVLMAGCTATGAPKLKAGLGCVDDSPRCMSERRQALESIMADKSRKWIGQSPTPAAYASGVRLFAYKKQKRRLTCAQLTIGRREALAARASLRSASGQLTPGQIARGALLGDEVALELTRERRRRGCKA